MLARYSALLPQCSAIRHLHMHADVAVGFAVSYLRDRMQ